MLSTSSQSVRPLKATKTPSATPQARQPRPSTQAVRKAAPASFPSSSLSSGGSTRPGPNRGSNSQPAPPKHLSTTKLNQPRNTKTKISATPRSSDQTSPEEGPLDDHIIRLAARLKDRTRVLKILKSELYMYGLLQDEPDDPFVAQLTRIVDQLEKKGECIVRGMVVRPEDGE